MLCGLLLAGALCAAPGEAWARSRVSCDTQVDALGLFEFLSERLSGFWGDLFTGLAGTVAGIYADECVRLNQIQVLGTHNSYHVEPSPFLLEVFAAFEPQAQYWEYTHRPLAEQFAELGIRQIELDVFNDPVGSPLADGRASMFASPIALQLEEADPDAVIPELEAPGLKVLHVQEFDVLTTCLFLVECLAQIKAWSDANPDHLPIAILVEAKDEVLDVPVATDPPTPWDAAAFAELDAVVRSVFPPWQLITPDDVRGGRPTLEDGATRGGWPTLGEARGRVLFTLDNKRAVYREGNPNLAGRVAFTDSQPGEEDAAFVKVNGPIGNEAYIQGLVADGYIVRTRADADTLEARLDDPVRRDAALASGATFVSSDYPEPDPRFSGYFVEIPGDGIARCNPVNAPPGCRDAALGP